MLSYFPKLFISTLFIFVFLWIGNFIQQHTGIPFPGSIIGMILLFVSMSSGLMPVEVIRPSASLILKYMIFFFIPISVGLMNYFDLLLDNMVLIIVCTVGSNLLVTIVLSILLKRFDTKDLEE